ncbi:MAG: flagellar FliJ family protein [Hydrogenimonas sp.]|nr:flagellar FliJ family protein [Hydrogenimonas sp.]
MPKNYRALTKLRKQELERAEMALLEINMKIEELKRKREVLRRDECEASMPKEGDGKKAAAHLALKRAIQEGIRKVEAQIEALIPTRERLQNELKAANIAYEQAKSMESKVVEDILKRESRRAQGALDEIASQQFWRLNNGRKGMG